MKTCLCTLCGRLLSPSQYRLKLLDHLICSSCEQVIVETPVGHFKYDLLKDKIKALLIG